MTRTRAHESRQAIEKLYIIMRHLFIRGSYKPTGVSGESLIRELLTLKPEIYGLMDDPEKIELDGLLYIIDRLPAGIDECRYVRLISREGLENSDFKNIVPPKRRRNCYRVDEHQMYVEMTRGRSDIYDILTHLTFMYIESEKIKRNSIDHKGRETLDWQKLREVVEMEQQGLDFSEEAAYSYLSSVLGRTFEETRQAGTKFRGNSRKSLFSIVYNLGKLAIDEQMNAQDREITFSATLRERIGHHVYGELWANKIKSVLLEQDLIGRPLHIISANLHSIVNVIYGYHALGRNSFEEIERLAVEISQEKKSTLAEKINAFASKSGLIEINDTSGTNISVQLIDLAKLEAKHVAPGIEMSITDKKKLPVLLVMDYAFGEQAYECLDELLKPYEKDEKSWPLNVQSVSIMGKAGILQGKKGDIMIPNAHVFEGTADNYPIKNGFKAKDFEGFGLNVYEGTMISVLGTSLQNRDVLRYFMNSSWQAIGLEMEGAHYQKAIQAASKIRNNINKNVKLFYAYYASDNPLETGSTLASGGLGSEGIRPTYLISLNIIKKIFSQ
ncbi:MAG: hypothetical protein ACFCUU_11580 [Cyclobacteriaceae bacterium]